MIHTWKKKKNYRKTSKIFSSNFLLFPFAFFLVSLRLTLTTPHQVRGRDKYKKKAASLW